MSVPGYYQRLSLQFLVGVYSLTRSDWHQNGSFQVVTGSEGSEIIVWDLHTGKKMLHINDSHNGEELSCMALDGTGQRLLTGARDGSAIVSM